MSEPQEKYIRLRVALVAVVFSLLLAVIGVKAAYLQIFQGPWLSKLAAEQYEKSQKMSGKRGIIYDRNATEMAVSLQVTSVAAYPGRIESSRQAAKDISKILKLKFRTLRKKLTSKKSFVWIKRHATPLEVEKIKQLNIEGIEFIPEYNRYYPNKTLAAQVIGFTGVDGNGLEGVEYYYDDYLKGANGNVTLLRDARGRRFVAAGQKETDYSGNNIRLTIDRTVQYIADKTLEETVTEYSAKSGIAIVMVPRTGALLAIAHYPHFNPNDFGKFSSLDRRNRSITDPFEPGSTMKIFSAAAAIESGGSSPNAIFFCENGAYQIGRKVVHDMEEHGWLSLQQIIKYSSNIGAIKISEMVGPERMYNTLVDFGFGSRTGIDCPGETIGTLHHYERWSRMDTSAISFGHGISVSPVQLITAVSAIANGGILMKPYIVSAILNQHNRIVYRFGPQKIRRVISEQTAAKVSKIMQTVVTEGGTGTQAALDSYTVCGKTGTAKKVGEEGTYTEDMYVASFVGFTPAQNAEIAVLVIIDEPQGKYYGGLVAAPAFSKIARQTLNYLNIPPVTNRQLAVSSVPGSNG
jgi:cell division protein FtsI (penicillin-binding protein 3)